MSLFLDSEELETLYDRHGSDVFNFCLRVTGSRDLAATASRAAFLAASREPEPSLLAAARRETAKLIEDPGAPPTSAGSPPLVREANERLQVRYREVLALRELLGCPYGEIGRIVGADHGGVAQLLWRARLELHDKLNGSRLTSIAPVAASCRRALTLIVMERDRELHDGDERDWLRGHLRTCGKCRVSQKAARAASDAYRAWAPAAPPVGLRQSLSFTDSAASQAAGS
jgi:DNA-directed RNA polymerase specialized sigma24 family protein